ncbi:MAG: glycosyltransferase family 4 protein [Candidatus Nealsonbacteria bacterium]|nr:glycosyltransferase family 4 protein [Candidatus Nealsonbacteria bacterium]
MKILMPALHYYPVVGGIETWTRNIAENVSKKAEVFVVTGRVKNRPNKEAAGGLRIFRTSFFTLSDLSRSPKIYTVSLLPCIFLKSLILMRQEKIDILHCQGFLSSFLGFCLSVVTRVPYITTVQRLEKKRNPLKNFIYRKAAFCIAASSAVKKNFEDIGVKKVAVIPNGVDLSRFENIKRQPREKFIVITVARLEKVKGVEYLIRALVDTRCQPSELMVIGDGSRRKDLENLVKQLKSEDSVEFLGEIPNEKIPFYLAMADCFVLPSIQEGFGIVVLEAQAAGLPVVASGVGGILDLIEDQKTGLLVEPGNVGQISEALFKIQSNPDFAKMLVENAKNVLPKYNWQNIANRVYDIYQKVKR